MNTTTFNLAAIQERNPQRQALAADVEAFLASGGRVTRCGNTLDPLVQRQSDRLPQELTVVPTHKRRAKAMPDALSGATAYLKLLGDVVGGWMLAKGALAAEGETDAAWAESKRALARVFAESVLAQVPGAAAGVMLGAADLAAMTPEVLGA